MRSTIRIGNQTAFSASRLLEPFEFALANGFEAFEWFPDKQRDKDGAVSGWDMADLDSQARQKLKEIGQSRKISYTVHAPWQANPLTASGISVLIESLEFARAIGAGLVNLHLYMDEGPERYVTALRPVILATDRLELQLSLENTPLITPGDCKATFYYLQNSGLQTDHVGLCLDIGHANLCRSSHNDYIRFVDELGDGVPIIHVHIHENFGDRDSHMTLFSGPAGKDDRGVKMLIDRLRKKNYQGNLVMEQWPQPPELLVEAGDRLGLLLNHHIV